jgi:bifunctional ADP-heptose synthase (sugar kinase/adenylyltransferase)
MDKIILIGDTIIDVNTEGTLLGTSSESPTLVISKNKETTTLGGAALVHRNLQQLHCEHQFITGISTKDRENNVFSDPTISYVYTQKNTTTKHRYWCDKYKLLQVDTIDNSPITKTEFEKIKTTITNTNPNLIIVADYRHGFLSNELITFINDFNKPIILDSQVSQNPANHHLYKNIYLTLLNQHEASQYALNVNWDKPEIWASELCNKLDSQIFIVKFAEKGCIYLDKEKNNFIKFKTTSVKNPIDTSGAGDAFLAGLISEWKNIPLFDGIKFAVNWATESVKVKGANPPNE